MTGFAWLGAAILLAGLNWLAVWHGWRGVNYASKALVIVSLFMWLASSTGFTANARFFATGLFFSLAGDILLLLSVRFFLLGLCAFLLAHTCYLTGFLIPTPSINEAIWSVGLMAFSLWALVYGAIRGVLIKSPVYRRLRLPLAAYSLLICAMTASAVLTLFHRKWPPQAAGLAVSGALLFLFSDMLLAYDRFLNPLPDARLWKRVSYHLGQIAIIAAIVVRNGIY